MTTTKRATKDKAERRVVRAAMRLYEDWLQLQAEFPRQRWYPLNEKKFAGEFGRACAALARTKR